MQALCTVLAYMGDSLTIEQVSCYRLVCRRWHDVLNGTSTVTAIGQVLEYIGRTTVFVEQKLRTLIGSKFIGMFPQGDMRDSRRLKLLHNSVEYARDLVVVSKNRSLLQLCAYSKQLSRVAECLRVPRPNGANVDMTDLALRRIAGNIANPTSACISDSAARLAWESAFGNERARVPWKTFCEQMKPQSDRCKTFLCFPDQLSSCPVVTAYSFHLFSSLYGPWKEDHAWQRFEWLADLPGFAGFATTERAEELFEMLRRGGAVLKPSCIVRYSRLCPETFSVTTYKPLTSELVHCRCKSGISIDQFVESLVSMGWNMVNQISTKELPQLPDAYYAL